MRKPYSPSVIILLAIAFSSMFANNSFAQAKENNAKLKWTNGNPFEHKLFIENKGQFDKKDTLANSNILYGVTLGEIQIYFTSSGLTYRRDEFAKGDEEDREEAAEKMKEGGKKMSDKITPHLIKLVWEGASPDAEIVAEDKADYFFSYPDVNDPTYKKSYEAQAYKKITYRNLYPNIDVVYYFPEGQSGIKYSIILHPGANPSVIKMKYSGECNSELDHEGNLILSSVFIGDFTDHAPQTYYQNNNGAILSSFSLSDQTLSFHLKNADKSQTIVIDPWTTNPNFTSYNAGYDIEYDLAGNAYIYGGDYPWQEMKLNAAGAILWTYSAALFYSTGCTGGPCYGDFCVDGTSGSSYLVEGFNGGSGTRVIKVNAAGAQVGVFPGAANFGEMWRAYFNNCSHLAIIAGGGISSTYQACILDTNVTNMTPVNVLGSPTALHDMCLLTLDNQNNCYMGAAQSLADPTNFANVLLKCPGATLAPNAFMVPDGHAFMEVSSIPYVDGITSDANGFNGITVSPNFLYTYDGATLKKWDKNSGALLATVAVTGTSFAWGGLDVDDCDNIYVGAQSSIKVYNSALALTSTIATANTVFDVRLGPNNTLFAVGLGFAQAFTLTSVCNPMTLAITGSGNCSSGTATVTPTGGVGPYTYLWTPGGQTTSTVSGLPLGTYSVTVMDASCIRQTQTATITITGSSTLATTAAQVNPVCFGGCNGTATTTVTGGVGPYTYSWSTIPIQTTATATGLCSGTYTCTAADANGCIITQAFTIVQPTVLTSSGAITNLTCYQAGNGGITLTVGGGTSGYTYLWSNAATTPNLTNIAAGSYSVTIADANGCTNTLSFVVTEPTQLTATATATTNFNGYQMSCTGSTNGAANLTVNGGTAGYNYLWSNAATSQNLSSIGAGTYNVTVTDAQGCTTTATVVLTEPTPLAAATTGTNVLCNGNLTGAVNLTTSGSVPAYSYNWSNAATTQNLTGVGAGTYSVVITDANSCTTTQSFTVTEPTLLTVTSGGFNVTCNGACDGQVVVIPAGGTPNYSFLWNSGCTNPNCSNICAGTYNVTVTDGNGCTGTSTSTVTEPPALTVTTTTTPSTCTAANGSATAVFSGGTGALTATWYNPSFVGATYNNIAAGNYYVVITDANNCRDTAYATVGNLSGVVASIGPVTNVLCHGGNNGQIVVNTNNLNSPYTYSWNCSASTTNTASNLTVGPCSVTVTDAFGCISTVSTTITEPTALTLTATTNPTAVCAGQPVALSSIGGGGTPGYQYAWMPGSLPGANQNVIPAATSTYSVYVTDANLCVDSATVSVTVNANPVSNLIGDSLSGCAPHCVNFTDLSTVAAPSTITGWSWDFGDGSPVSPVQNPSHCYLTPGVYSVTLTTTTSATCSNTFVMSNYVQVFANPVAAFTASPQPASELDPEITFTDQSLGAFSWLWNFDDSDAVSNLQNPSFSYLVPKCYNVILTVTTVNNCVDSTLREVCIDPDVELFVPNAFTPNGDGINDYFFPKGIGMDESKYELWIFDRWGNLIFYTSDWNKGWDGKVQGHEEFCQIDTYVWKIKVYDLLGKRHNLIGKVSLVK